MPIALQLDTGNPGAFDRLRGARCAKALAEWGAGRFDYLVNNAGTSSSAGLGTITEAETDALYNVHFKGVLFLTQKLLPLMNDGGRIVNISSGLDPLRRAQPHRLRVDEGGGRSADAATWPWSWARAGSRPTSSRRAPSPPISAAASSGTIRR